MNEEARELVRQFLRKWSTIELTQEARAALKEDAKQTRTLLEVMEVECEVLADADHAPDRHWFAKKFQEFTGQERA